MNPVPFASEAVRCRVLTGGLDGREFDAQRHHRIGCPTIHGSFLTPLLDAALRRPEISLVAQIFLTVVTVVTELAEHSD